MNFIQDLERQFNEEILILINRFQVGRKTGKDHNQRGAAAASHPIAAVQEMQRYGDRLVFLILSTLWAIVHLQLKLLAFKTCPRSGGRLVCVDQLNLSDEITELSIAARHLFLVVFFFVVVVNLLF